MAASLISFPTATPKTEKRLSGVAGRGPGLGIQAGVERALDVVVLDVVVLDVVVLDVVVWAVVAFDVFGCGQLRGA